MVDVKFVYTSTDNEVLILSIEDELTKKKKRISRKVQDDNSSIEINDSDEKGEQNFH